MKNTVWLLIFTIFASCNFEETEESASLFSGHREVENSATLSGPASKTYVEGEAISFVLTHPYRLSVTGNPRIALDVGGSSVFANYVSGNGTKNLTFTYWVAAGDEDLDGIAVSSTSVDLNGGSVQFDGTAGTQNANLNFSAPNASGALVDTVSPTVSSVTAPLPLTYYLADEMSFYVTFDEAVDVSGAPQMPITLGGSTVYANYVSGSGGTTLLFKYSVTSSDYDMDGITITSPIGLNGGSINDSAGNAAALTYALQNAPTVYADGDSPVVVTFTPPSNGTYTTGQDLDFSLQFSEIVNVTGAPRLLVDLDGTTVYANYITGSGTDTLNFTVEVVPGNVDEDGIDVTNLIDLNGGTIQDAGARDAYLIFEAPLTPGVLVDSPLPVVTSISLPTPPADNYWNSGETIYVTLNFNEVVNVTGGIPRIPMQLDSSGSDIMVEYSGGTGTQSLVFRYVVVDEVDEDHTGFTINSPIDLNGAQIQNAQGTNIDTDMAAIAAALDTSAMLVDATTPVVSSITAPADNTYAIGDQINFVLNYSEIVNVTGSPRIQLDIGGSTRYATYAGGSGSSSLTFRWTVQQNYEDTDGIQVSLTSVQQNGGTIIDRGANETDYDITGLIPDLSNVFVDGIRPVISSVTIPANTYDQGQTVTATITFDDTVNVAGGPPQVSATFENQGGSPAFVYQGGTGSTTLTFDYTVVSGDEDLNGIALAAAIATSGGTIQDVNGNNATLTLSTTSFPTVYVDAMAPIVNITSPANGDYINIASDSVNYAIAGTCNDATATYDIRVDGVSAPGQAGVSCDGANLSGTFNSTGHGEGARSITIFSTDTSANTATSPAVSVTKDTVAPTISSISAVDNNYTVSASLDLTANFSEPVNVSSTQISFTMATSSQSATYSSGAGSSNIIYRYTVTSSDYDGDGIVVSSPLQLGAGSITDLAANPISDLTFAAPATGNVRVNDGTPAFDWQDGGVSIASYDYGNPGGVTASKTFTIENIGDAPASASINVTVSGGQFNKAAGMDNCSGITLPIGGTCTVTIEYNDLSIGTIPGFSGTGRVDDAGFGTPTYNLNLSGD